MLRILAKWLRQAIVAGLIVSLTAYGVVVVACLPRTVQVELVEARSVASANQMEAAESPRLILLTATREGEPLEFRNDNTNWGFPPYFKFDAAELQSKARQWVAGGRNQSVVVRYYGFRIGRQWLIPNAISMERADDYEPPLVSPVWGVAGLHGLVALAMWRWLARRRRSDAMDDETHEEI